MKALGHKVVALTGAASGIGQMLAVRLADHRCRLALCDINEAGLEQTKKMAESRGTSVTCHLVNVADRKQMYEFASNVAEIHGGVDMIINNAGVALAESITDVKYDDFEWLFGINFWGVVYGSKAFLPYLIKQPEGHIVNISSINGFITWPNHAPYCAAKFAVRGFTETLMQEMRNTHVHVSCVFPGGLKPRSPGIPDSTRLQTISHRTMMQFDASIKWHIHLLTWRLKSSYQASEKTKAASWWGWMRISWTGSQGFFR